MRREHGGGRLTRLALASAMVIGVCAAGERPGVAGAEQIDRGVDGGPHGAADVAGPPFARILEMTDIRARETTLDGRITVEVVGPGARRAVRDLAPDAEILGTVRGLALARLTAAEVERLEATGLVVRLPREVGDAEVTTALTDADLLGPTDVRADPAVERGDGAAERPRVKVGVVSLFDMALYRRQVAQGRVPEVPAANRRCFTRGGRCPFGTDGVLSGNAAAQIIYGENRDVELYLVEFGGLVDLRNAIDWMAEKGVTVVHVNSTVPWDGPGDGTGPAAALVDRAVRKGMTWISSAGDQLFDPSQDSSFRGSYWRGTWRDKDGDGWMNFPNGRESIGVRCGFLYGLRWSDWGRTITDYDLYVGDATANSDGTGFTEGRTAWNVGVRDQSARGAQPLEANTFLSLCNRNPRYGPVIDENRDGYVAVYIEKTDRTPGSTTGDVLELGVLHGLVDVYTPRGSHQAPFSDSRNPGMVSVGARADEGGLAVEPAGFSSRGPTNDGRIKPDVVATGCARIFRFRNCDAPDRPGGWFSTSVSAQLVTARVAAYQALHGVDDPSVLPFIVRHRTFWSQLNGRRPAQGVGWGVLLGPTVDRNLSFVPYPSQPRVTFSSPEATRGRLDRWFELTLPRFGDEPVGQTPGTVEVSVTGARRSGVVEVVGASDLPGSGPVIRVEKGTPLRVTVPVRDVRTVHLHSTTGGDLDAVVRVWPVVGPYAAVMSPAPSTLRSLSDPAVLPGSPVSLAVDDQGALVEPPTGLVVRVTAVPAAAAQVTVGGMTTAVPRGGRTWTQSLGATAGRIPVRSSVSARIQIDLLGSVLSVRQGTKGFWAVEPVRVTQRTIAAGAAVPVSFASAGLPARTRYVLLRVATEASSPGVLVLRERDGVDRPVHAFGGGRSSSIVPVAVDDLATVIRSTAAGSVTIDVVGYSTTPTMASPPVEAPPMRIEAASRASISGDGTRVVIVGNGRTPTGVVPETSGRLWLWDRTADTMEPVVVDTAGGVPDAPVALVAIAQDGLSVAFTSRATDLVTPTPPAARALYVQDLETGTLERFALANVTAAGESIVDASSDLTTFVTSAGKVVRIRPDRSALTVVQSYAGYVGIDVSADGSRVLLGNDRETRVADVSSSRPRAALPYLPGASLSGDGTKVALSVGVYSAGGTQVSSPCMSGEATMQTAIDMDGSTVVWGGYCPTDGIVEAAVSVSQDAGRTRLLLSSAIRPIPSLSADGSTAVVVANRVLVGAHILR